MDTEAELVQFEDAKRQGMWAASQSWKSQENEFSHRTSKITQSCRYSLGF